MRNIDQRREDSNRPIAVPDLNEKVGIENVTFSSADARFLNANRNKYTSTMPMQMKGLEHSEARLMHDMYKTMRGTLLEGGKTWMKAVAAKQNREDRPAIMLRELELQRDEVIKKYEGTEWAEVEVRNRTYNREVHKGTPLEKERHTENQTAFRDASVAIDKDDSLSEQEKESARLKLYKEYLDEQGH
tara:strand:- start:158 stop:721 length:564 start_codon:yes stop_codon:yes gene_type:complete